MPKYINLLNMSSALTLNASNALFVVNFLDQLPAEIKSHIVEYNPEHRKAMNVVFDQMIRYVFCPYYFVAPIDNAFFETMENFNSVNQELFQINRCYLCNNIKEAKVLLKQMKIGLWTENGEANMSDEINYCGECYHDIRHWDRTKYVKHFVINNDRYHSIGYPFNSWSYISPNDTIKTIIDSFDMMQNELDKYEKRMPYGVYDNECENINEEKKYLIDLYIKTRINDDSDKKI